MNTADQLITGIFDDRKSAEDAVQRLHALGYTRDEISVMMDNKTHAREFADKNGTNAATGAVTGAVIGGGLAAIVAGLTATGSVAAIAATGGLAAPIVVGPLAAALAALGAGGATGGIVGALIGVGIPKDRAKKYESRLHDGGIMLGVAPRDDDREGVDEIFGYDRERAGSL